MAIEFSVAFEIEKNWEYLIVGHEGLLLVQIIEEEFGIGIGDADIARLTTPAQVADYVFERLSSIDGIEAGNLSQEGFHRLRAVLVRCFGARRRDVYPDTPIAEFLTGNIRQQWAQLKSAIDAAGLPRLHCRKCISYPLMGGVPLLGAGIAWLLGAPSWAMVLTLFGLWVAAALITDRIGDQIPEGLSTVGALVPFVSISTPDDWKREDVLQRVLQLTAAHLDMPLSAIEPGHRFAEDLSLDD